MHLDTANQEYDKMIRNRLYKLFLTRPDATYRDIQRQTGIGRNNITRSFEEDRVLKWEEIEPLCNYFGITIGQMDGTDFAKKMNELSDSLSKKEYLGVLSKSEELLSIAIIPSEKVHVLIVMAQTLLKLKRYKDAERIILKGINMAEENSIIHQIEKSRHIFLRILLGTKQYDKMANLAEKWLGDVSFNFRDSHKAKLKHYLGMSYYFQGDKIKARKYYSDSIEFFEKSGEGRDNKINIARLKTTIGDMDYHNGRYEDSISLYQDALTIQQSEEDEIERIMETKKDIARCLYMLDRKGKALELAEASITEIDRSNIDAIDVKHKIMLLVIDIKKDFSLCKQIVDSNSTCLESRVNAADMVLQEHFKGGGFERSFLEQCYKLVRDYGSKFTEFKWGVWY